MKLKLETEEIDLPNTIYLDQLMLVDLELMEQIKTKTIPPQDLLRWFVNFFKAIGIPHRWELKEFIPNQEQLIVWLGELFEGFQTSN